MKERLTKIVQLRVTEKTHKTWNKEANRQGLTLADWLRSQVKINGTAEPLTCKPPAVKRKKRNYTPADPKLINQISRAGNNLNQIARWCNSHKEAGDTVQVVAHLIAIQRSFDDAYKI